MPGLAPKARLLALELARGATVRDAARAAGIPERTARRYAADEAFRAEVRSITDAIVAEAMRSLVATLDAAVTALAESLASDDDRVRVRAAKVILDSTLNMRSHVELSERVAKLEEGLHARDQRSCG